MSHANFVLRALILISLSACATPTPQARSTPVASPTTQEIFGSPRYALPTLVDQIGRIVAPVSINDQGPFNFMVDTGATHTVLSSQLVTRLDLPLHGFPTVSVQGVSGVASASTVRVDSLHAGAVQLSNFRVPVLLAPVMDGVDGILGAEGFAGKKITANFMRDEVRITESDGKRAAARYTVVRFELVARRLILVNARVGRMRIKAVVDTGGAHTLGNQALLKLLISNPSGARILSLPTDVVDVTATSQTAALVLVPRISLGGAVVVSLPVSFGDFQVFKVWDLHDQPALLIGMDVLGMLGELTIDYRRKELHIAPYRSRH